MKSATGMSLVREGDIRSKTVGYFGHVIGHSTLQHALSEGERLVREGDIRSKTVGYFGHVIGHSTLQHALSEGQIECGRSRGRERTTRIGQQGNKVVRIGECGGNKEGKGQELLAATHCIRPCPAAMDL